MEVRKSRIYGLTALSLAAFLILSVYSVPGPEWQKETISSSVDRRFFDVASADGKLFVAYRNSSEGGVFVASKPVNGLFSFLSGWSREEVSAVPGSGSYLSLEVVGGEPAAAYQVAETGDERVVYTERNGGNWTVEKVEGVAGGGVNVGMYTSLTSWKDKPLVLYHSPTQGLKSALKTEEGWRKEKLGGDLGWFTATASCGRKAFAAFRGRGSKQLRLATFDGNWSVRNVSGAVKSGISVSQRVCAPHVAYLSADEEIKYRLPGGETVAVAGSDFTDLSLRVEDGARLSYYSYGEGVFFGSWNGSSWRREELRGYREAGRYNRFERDSRGDLHVFYPSNGSLIHEEKAIGTSGDRRQLLQAARLVSGLVVLASAGLSAVLFGGFRNPSRVLSRESDAERED